MATTLRNIDLLPLNLLETPVANLRNVFDMLTLHSFENLLKDLQVDETHQRTFVSDDKTILRFEQRLPPIAKPLRKTFSIKGIKPQVFERFTTMSDSYLKSVRIRVYLLESIPYCIQTDIYLSHIPGLFTTLDFSETKSLFPVKIDKIKYDVLNFKFIFSNSLFVEPNGLTLPKQLLNMFVHTEHHEMMTFWYEHWDRDMTMDAPLMKKLDISLMSNLDRTFDAWFILFANSLDKYCHKVFSEIYVLYNAIYMQCSVTDKDYLLSDLIFQYHLSRSGHGKPDDPQVGGFLGPLEVDTTNIAETLGEFSDSISGHLRDILNENAIKIDFSSLSPVFDKLVNRINSSTAIGTKNLADASGKTVGQTLDGIYGIGSQVKILTGCVGLALYAIGKINSNPTYVSIGEVLLTGIGAYMVVSHWTSLQVPQGTESESTLTDTLPIFFEQLFSVRGFSKHIKECGFIVMSLDKIRKSVPEMVMIILQAVDSCFSWLFDVEPFAFLFPKWLGSSKAIKDCISKIQRYCNDFRLGSDSLCVDEYLKVNDLLVELDTFVVGAEKTAPKYNLLLNYRKDLEEIRKTLLTSIPGLESSRIEPATCLFLGAPGSYKTTMMGRLGEALKVRIQRDKKLSALPAAFGMTGSLEYFEGFASGTEIVTWDEFGQDKDVAGVQNSQYKLLISMVNSNPFCLNMAAVENKGTTFFKANFLLATTNSSKWQIESIVDPGAVDRRWQKQYVVCPKKEFSKDPNAAPIERTVDWDKVAAIKGLDEKGAAPDLNDDDMEFYRRTGTTYDKKVSAMPINFTEIIDELYESHLMKVHIYTRNALNSKISAVSYAEIVEIERTSDSILLNSQKYIDEMINEPSDINMYTLSKILTLEPENSQEILKQCVPGFQEWMITKGINVKDRGTVLVEELLAFHHNRTFRKKWATGKLNCVREQLLLKTSDFFKSNYEHLRIVRNGLAMVVPLIGAAYGVWKLLKPPTIAGDPTQSVSQKQKVVEIKNLSGLMREQKTQMGFVGDSNGYNLIKATLNKNQYTIYLENTSDSVLLSGYGLFVVGGMLMVPKHFIQTFALTEKNGGGEKHVMFVQSRAGIKRIRTMTISELLKRVIKYDCLRNLYCDVGFIRMPISWGAHADIRKLFKRKANYSSIISFDHASLVTNHNQIVARGSQLEVEREFVMVKCRAAYKESHAVKFLDGVKDIGPLCMYNAQTENGSCGSVLVDFNPKIQQAKVIGIHVSGSDSGYGHTQIVFEEDLNECFDTFFLSTPESINECWVPDDTQIGTLSHALAAVKKVAPARTHVDSSYIRAQTSGLLMEPQLFPSDVRSDQVFLAIAPYRRGEYPPINHERFDKVIDCFINYLFSSSEYTVPIRLVDYEECVLGVTGYDFPVLSRMTSPGYPYVLTRKKKGKCDWLGDADNLDVSNDNWKKLVFDTKELEKECGLGHRQQKPFMINLKDELRKPGKLARVFGAGPLDLLLLCYRYFGSFIAWYQRNRISNGSTLGINSYSNEWTRLAMHLKYPVILAGDFKQFDLSQHPDIVYKLKSIIDRFYGDCPNEEKMVRSVLFMDVICPLYVYGDTMYESNGGLPSGHLLTATVNTLFNSVLQIYGVWGCMGFNDQLYTLLEHFTFVCNGDDSLVSIKEADRELITEEKLSLVFADLGMVYTSDTKDGTFAVGRDLSEVTFLKRYFNFDPASFCYLSPLKLDRLFEFPNWTKKRDGNQILHDNLEKLLVELSAHGEDTFLEHSPKIVEAFSKYYGSYPKYWTYLACVNRFRTTTEFPSTTQMNTTKAITTRDLGAPSINECPLISYPQMNESEVDAVFLNDALTTMSKGSFNQVIEPMVDARAGAIETTMTRWLERPINYLSGSLSSTDGPTTFANHLWHQPLSNVILKEKLRGTYSMRADLRIRVVVNANPFQQGLYILAYVPFGFVSYELSDTIAMKMHRHSLTQITQLPHVKIDLACDTEGELIIPWSSGQNSLLMNDTPFEQKNLGRFFIYPAVPLRQASGSPTASYTIWTNYEKISLGTVAYPQMGRRKVTLDLLTAEQEGKKISTYLATGAAISGALSSVPWLASVTTPLTWMLEASSKAAKAWGFSKPLSLDPPCRMARSSFVGMSNCDYPAPIDSMALTMGNHVLIDEGNAGNFDELDLQSIVSRPAWFTSASWSSTDDVGASILTQNISATMYSSTTDSGHILRNYLPMGFPTNYFQHWRGSIYVKLHFVKTGFHSGRILAVFDPSTNGSHPSGYVGTDYLMRVLIDVRESEEVVIRIPYVSVYPWLEREAPIGLLRLYVADVLASPPTVSSTITVFCEAYGAEDMQFNAPTRPIFVPIVPDSLQMGDSECSLGTHTFGETGHFDPNPITHGQAIVSMRQLLKRACPYVNVATTMSTTQKVDMWPFSSFLYAGDGTTILGDSSAITRDLYTVLSTIYCYSRGGVVIRVVPSSTNSTQGLWFSTGFSGGGAVVNQAVYTSVSSLNATINNIVGKAFTWSPITAPGQGHFIPQHTKTLSRISVNGLMTPTKPMLPGTPCSDPTVATITQYGSSGVAVVLTREGADDASFGYFISIPPMWNEVREV